MEEDAGHLRFQHPALCSAVSAGAMENLTQFHRSAKISRDQILGEEKPIIRAAVETPEPIFVL